MFFQSPGRSTVKLARDQLVSRRTRAPATVRVMVGRVWVTQSGDVEDHFMQAGESLSLWPGALVVFEALEPSTVEVCTPESVALARLQWPRWPFTKRRPVGPVPAAG